MTRFSNIHVRRMYWAFFSEPLLRWPDAVGSFLDSRCQPSLTGTLQQLDTEHRRVDEHFNALGHLPMGKYFEQLVFFALREDPQFDVLHTNLQFSEKGRTTGEADLIVRDRASDTIEHWEIALKFYLQHLPTEEHINMIGPNSKDTLHRKMKRLTTHQLILPEQLEHLTGLKRDRIRSRLFLKGQFFYHLGNEQIRPRLAHPEHGSGSWCRISEATGHFSSLDRYAIVHKPDYIGLNERQATISRNELLAFLHDRFMAQHGPLLIIHLSKTQGKTWRENGRTFVVRNDWPATS